MPIKYEINFGDRLGVAYKIEIDHPDYIGDAIQLIPAENPLVISWEGNNDDDIFKTHIIPSNATMTVVSTGIVFDDFFYISDASMKCRIYKNAALYWQGYIISDGIQEADSGVPFDVTLTAIDGLELMDNIRFAWSDNYPAIVVDGQTSIQRCPMNAIRLAVLRSNNLDNALPIRWNSSLENDSKLGRDMLAGATAINPFGDLSDAGYTCAWWINNISKSAQSWFYQKNGYWYINRYFDSLSGGFNGLQISPDTSTIQTATEYDGNELVTVLDSDTINESWFWHGKKPLGRVNINYIDTKFPQNNAVPNGSFDRTSLSYPLFWSMLSGNNTLISTADPINDEINGASIRVDNSTGLSNPTPVDDYLTFGSIPLDANVLFKEALFSFTFLAVSGFAVDGDSKILEGQLRARIRYTAYQEGIVKNLYLNEFGFWSGYGTAFGGLSILSYYVDGNNVRVRFAGAGANAGQSYSVRYDENPPNDPVEHVEQSYTFTSNVSFATALSQIATATGGAVAGDEVFYSSIFPSGESAYITGSEESQSDITFQYTNAKEGDIVSVQFQSKGLSSGIKLPDPNEITPDISDALGRLSIEIFSKAGTVMQLDDMLFQVSDNHDVYEVAVQNSKNSTENYEMGISSGFSGFMVSSYGDKYDVVNRSQWWNGGYTLSELYGRAVMDVRNNPCRIFSGTIDKTMEWGLFSLMGRTYAPLSVRLNVKDCTTDVVGCEFNPIAPVSGYTVTHKSSGG